MPIHSTAFRLTTMAAAAVLVAACGGGGSDPAPTISAQNTTARQQALRGGVITPDLIPCPLPTTAPAPDVLVRESFGFCTQSRPAGGKGDPRYVFASATLGGFWVEYPGSKATEWITPDGAQTWKFAGIGGFLDPYELPSPLQTSDISQGAIISDWADTVTQSPTALMPLTPPATPYAVSMEGYPSVVAGAYVAIGLTSSGATISNLETVGQVWLNLRKQEVMVNGPLVYELRLNGRSGTLLATGVVDDVTWNQMSIRYDPVNLRLSATVNGNSLGEWPLAMATPHYAGFEGVGVLDNFVIRSAP